MLRTDIAQPLLFIVEYALAKLLMRWGVRPEAMMGHSIGEYVAACLAAYSRWKKRSSLSRFAAGSCRDACRSDAQRSAAEADCAASCRIGLRWLPSTARPYASSPGSRTR